jgi:hypothetical protein
MAYVLNSKRYMDKYPQRMLWALIVWSSLHGTTINWFDVAENNNTNTIANVVVKKGMIASP